MHQKILVTVFSGGLSLLYLLTKVFPSGLSSWSISALFTMGVCPTKPHIFVWLMSRGLLSGGVLSWGLLSKRAYVRHLCHQEMGLRKGACICQLCIKQMSKYKQHPEHFSTYSFGNCNCCKLPKATERLQKTTESLPEAAESLPKVTDN